MWLDCAMATSKPQPATSRTIAFGLSATESIRFMRALRVTATFASSDASWPVGGALRVTSDGHGTVTMEATDSYRLVKITLGSVRTPADLAVPTFDVLLPGKWLIAQLPKAKRVVGVGFDLTRETVTVRDLDYHTSATAPLITGTYPNTAVIWDNRADEYVAGLDGKEFGLNPTLLSKVLKSCSDWASADVQRIRVSSLDLLKPVRFDVDCPDGDMAATLMPMRLP